MLADPALQKLSFTGSTPVGRRLLVLAAANVLRISMELGGNAPFLVLQDADLDVALPAAVHAKMRNAGQACTAANRFYVHESLAPEFAERLNDRFHRLVLELVRQAPHPQLVDRPRQSTRVAAAEYLTADGVRSVRCASLSCPVGARVLTRPGPVGRSVAPVHRHERVSHKPDLKPGHQQVP